MVYLNSKPSFLEENVTVKYAAVIKENAVMT